MADEPVDQPTSDVARIQALKNILIAIQRYPEAYGAFKKTLEVDGIPFSWNDPRFIEEAVKFSQTIQEFLVRDQVPELELETIAPREVIEKLNVELQKLPETISSVRKKRVTELVNTYVSELQKQTRMEGVDAFRELLTQAAVEIIEHPTTPDTVPMNIEEEFVKTTTDFPRQPSQVERLKQIATPIARRVIQGSKPIVRALATPLSPIQTNQILEATVVRKDILVKVIAGLAGITPNPDIQEAIRLTRTAETITAKPEGNIQTNIFFRSNTKSPLGGLVDSILSVLPKHTQERIKQTVIRRTWDDLVQPDQLIKRFGESVVGSLVFQKALEHGLQSVGGEPLRVNAGGPVGKLKDVAWDIFLFFSGKPPIIEELLIFETTGVLVGETIYPASIPVAAARNHSPHLFEAFFHVGREATGEAAGWMLRKTLGQAAGKVAFGTAIKALAGRFFGAIAGLFTGTGPVGAFLGGLVGGKLFEFVGGLFGKLFSALSGGWLTNLITGARPGPQKPMMSVGTIVTIALAIILLPIIMLTIIITPGAMIYGLTAGGGDVGSKYITLTKTANPAAFPDNNPTSITYTITVKPTNAGDTLEITDIHDDFTVLAKSGSPTIPSPNISSSDVAGGKAFSYTIALGPQFKDSLIANSLTVVANVAGKIGETTSVSTSVIIGNPPTECFVFAPGGVPDAYGHTSTAWDNQSGVLAAIAILSKSKSYMAYVCSTGAVNLHRVKANFGGGSVSGDSDIFLYNAGVSGTSAVYTLAHEGGHIISHRTNLFDTFHDQGLYTLEGPIWTYPNGYQENEDFAETLGVYPVWKSYTFRKRGTTLNYPVEYPKHYDFAKGVFGVEF